jgi:hypothetical protein
MQNVRVSDEATVHVAELANREGLTIPEATDRLIETGYNRLRALKKWRRKDKRARTTQSRTSRTKHAA